MSRELSSIENLFNHEEKVRAFVVANSILFMCYFYSLYVTKIKKFWLCENKKPLIIVGIDQWCSCTGRVREKYLRYLQTGYELGVYMFRQIGSANNHMLYHPQMLVQTQVLQPKNPQSLL